MLKAGMSASQTQSLGIKQRIGFGGSACDDPMTQLEGRWKRLLLA
jgi:hypothetical protein